MAVDELQEAFGTSDEHERAEAIQEAAKNAIGVPVETAEECLAVLEYATVVTQKGNRNTIADAGTGAFLAHGALQSSVLTAQLNLEMTEDENFIAEVERRPTEIDNAATRAFEQVEENVSDAF